MAAPYTLFVNDATLLREAYAKGQFDALPPQVRDAQLRMLGALDQIHDMSENLFLCRTAMKKFCDRVELGEVRSVKTYNQFKELLEKTND